MTQAIWPRSRSICGTAAMAIALAGTPGMPTQGLAKAPKPPVDLLAPAAASPAPVASPSAVAPVTPAPATPAPAPAPAPAISPAPVVAASPEPDAAAMATPFTLPARPWTIADAQALLGVITSIDREGLLPADYQPDALRTAIAAGESQDLNELAAKIFTWLVEDLRDGRTPMEARVQWFAVDPDRDAAPTETVLNAALDNHDIAGALAALAPTHPDYAVLKAALAATPRADSAGRDRIRANMDRWRWLARDLGTIYLITNVPEFQLRLTVNNRIIRTYRTIVGKPGRTATPQLAEQVQGVVFNPTWTVPQSIVVGEGLGARLLANPASAARQGYKATRAADGMVTVVQQPGPNNSLGLMKIDMPNPHAIYLHDTPSKHLFNAQVRAFSHGCIRTERASELGMTMAILGAGLTPEQGVQYANSGKYTRVTMTRTFPVYLTYFTMARDITGKLTRFNDIYGRDAPVLASFQQPRQLHTDQRTSTEEIIKLDNPL